MSEAQYRVVLQGYAAGAGEYYIEVEFAKLFKITPEKAKEVLKSAPQTIKENLSLELAEKYKSAIEKTGAVCELENMKYDTSGLSLE
jgi:hypothetical protein